MSLISRDRKEARERERKTKETWLNNMAFYYVQEEVGERERRRRKSYYIRRVLNGIKRENLIRFLKKSCLFALVK